VADIRSSIPGVLLSAAVAISAVTAARLLGGILPIPAMVVALVIGIAINPLARRRLFQPGILLCLRVILRWAVALLGLRIALAEIAALGLSTAILVVIAMAITLAAGFLLARLFALERAYGALAGAGTAVCGASATLATSIVLPDYKGKETDIVFVVVAVNALSTLAMVVRPRAIPPSLSSCFACFSCCRWFWQSAGSLRAEALRPPPQGSRSRSSRSFS